MAAELRLLSPITLGCRWFCERMFLLIGGSDEW
jgi:hypothetical protein